MQDEEHSTQEGKPEDEEMASDHAA